MKHTVDQKMSYLFDGVLACCPIITARVTRVLNIRAVVRNCWATSVEGCQAAHSKARSAFANFSSPWPGRTFWGSEACALQSVCCGASLLLEGDHIEDGNEPGISLQGPFSRGNSCQGAKGQKCDQHCCAMAGFCHFWKSHASIFWVTRN